MGSLSRRINSPLPKITPVKRKAVAEIENISFDAKLVT
jgi:hypothetical protein